MIHYHLYAEIDSGFFSRRETAALDIFILPKRPLNIFDSDIKNLTITGDNLFYSLNELAIQPDILYKIQYTTPSSYYGSIQGKIQLIRNDGQLDHIDVFIYRYERIGNCVLLIPSKWKRSWSNR